MGSFAGKQIPIWNPETAIEDYLGDPAGLAVPESARIREEWAALREGLAGEERLQAFSDQLAREWSIETGIIENLYDIDRGVTQTLIEQGFQASVLQNAVGSINRAPEYIKALLDDQQAALEGLFTFVKQERVLTAGYIKELHAMMTRSQPVTEAVTSTGERVEVPMIHGDWKKLPNYPVREGIQYLYCPPEQVASEIDRLVQMHREHEGQGVPPEVEAAWLHHRFSQIHPFQDGNGRVARSLASLVLIRGGMFPLIVPRDEKRVYLQCLEIADSGDLRPLVRLIARRQEREAQRARDASSASS